ncbi:MAG TPA: DUF86 domain-containing protein [Bacteroidota bacterium]
MRHDDAVYLKHIRDAISKIEAYTKRVSKPSFLKNTLIQDGVIRQLEIIGEATKRLSDKFRDENSDIEWQDIAGMRDKLIHNYLGVDVEKVWLTIQKDVPMLKKEVSRVLESL